MPPRIERDDIPRRKRDLVHFHRNALRGSLAVALALGITATVAGTTATAATQVVTNDSKTGTTPFAFSYGTGWSTSTGVTKYGSDDHFAKTAGATVAYRFTGTRATIYGAVAPHHGRATVVLDSRAAVTIDTYAAARKDNTGIYTTPVLPYGAHKITLRVSGTHRLAATDSVVSVDRAWADTTTTGTPTPTPTPTTPAGGVELAINDASTGSSMNQFQYASGWQTSSGVEKFQGDDHYTVAAGALVTLRFRGTKVTAYGAKAAHHGQATVKIDGGTATTIDQAAATRQDNVAVYTSPVLAYGDHTLTVTSRDAKPVSVDRVVVSNAPKPTDPPTTTPPPTTPPPVTTGGAITRSGNTILRNGEPWWFVGYNSFVWTGNCGDGNEVMSQGQVDEWFASMRHDGHAAVRLFFFRGWDVADLDAALVSAKKHNVYLTVTLDDAIAGCGTSDKNGGWFGDSGARANYKDHMVNLLGRYKGEKQIAWFEYFNEPGGDNTWSALRDFYNEMGDVANGIDPSRLFSSGTVAPYWLGDDEGSDNNPNFRAVSESRGVDIVSLHEYDMGEIASNHLGNVIANSGGKPVIAGEYGITASESGSGCGDSYSSRAGKLTAKAEAYARTPGAVGGFVWAWTPGHGGDCTHSTGLNDGGLISGLKSVQG